MAKSKRNAREDILNTAEELFAAKGIENVSLRAINAAAGYSAAALHYHFKTRENLLAALLTERQEPVMGLTRLNWWSRCKGKSVLRSQRLQKRWSCPSPS